MKPILTLLLLFWQLTLSLFCHAGSASLKSNKPSIDMEDNKIELIIVFTKETELEDAQLILGKAGVKYREGMDSSRGKLYFYETGPKFILSFENKKDRTKFISKYENLKEVYEIYIPDWTKHKD